MQNPTQTEQVKSFRIAFERAGEAARQTGATKAARLVGDGKIVANRARKRAEALSSIATSA